MPKNVKPRTILFVGIFAPGTEDDQFDFARYRNLLGVYHKYIFQALQGLGFTVVTCRDPISIVHKTENVDFVVTLFEGSMYPSGIVVLPALCEGAGIPLLGAPAASMALDVDKLAAKSIAWHSGISTPEWIMIDDKGKDGQSFELPWKGIVKYRYGDNSDGITEQSILPPDVTCQLRELANVDLANPIFVERFIEGFDVTVGVVANRRDLIVGRPIRMDTDSPSNIQTFSHKFSGQGSRTKEWFDDHDAYELIKNSIKKLHTVIRPWDYARIDFRIERKTGIPHFLEINLMPNLDPSGNFTIFMVENSSNAPSLLQTLLTVSFLR